MSFDNELSEVLGSWNSLGKSKIPIKPETHHQRGKDPYLVFKNTPPGIDLVALINICSGYGNVLRGRKHELYNMFFINFATMNDLMNVVERLKGTQLAATMELGKILKDQQSKSNPIVSPISSAFTDNEIQRDKERIRKRNNTIDETQQSTTNKSQNNTKRSEGDITIVACW